MCRASLYLAGPVLAVLIGLSGGAAAQQAPRAVPVEAVQVDVTQVDDTVVVVGSLGANEQVVVRPEVAGRIKSIHFKEGEVIAKDALLFRLDDAIRRAELVQAEAKLNLAKRNAQRARSLFDRGAGTQRAQEETETDLETTAAALQLARAQLEKTEIRAPFAGILGLRLVSVGAYVEAGRDLVHLDSVDPIKVDFRVPERFFSKVRVGQTVRVAVEAFGEESFIGEVYATAASVDRDGRSLAVRARIPNSEGRLRPGLFAKVVLTIASRPDAIVVPEQAVVTAGKGPSVFVVVDGKAVARMVTTGQRMAGRVEIVDGLRPGDVVVTAGQLKIRDGSPVAVAKPNP
jgi:membrane fusion protein, multidrug efflux system